MAYIGKTPVIGNFQVCDAISVVNNQAIQEWAAIEGNNIIDNGA